MNFWYYCLLQWWLGVNNLIWFWIWVLINIVFLSVCVIMVLKNFNSSFLSWWLDELWSMSVLLLSCSMCNLTREKMLFLVQAIFKPPKAIRGGIPICFPQVCSLLFLFILTILFNCLVVAWILQTLQLGFGFWLIFRQIQVRNNKSVQWCYF
jgi:hypothetical protein